MTSDPTRRELPGSYLADDEGTAARPVPLLEGGRVVGALTDRRTAGAGVERPRPLWRLPPAAAAAPLGPRRVGRPRGPRRAPRRVRQRALHPRRSRRATWMPSRAGSRCSSRARSSSGAGASAAPWRRFVLTSDVLTALRNLWGEPGEVSARARAASASASSAASRCPSAGASPAILLRGLTAVPGRAVTAAPRRSLRGDPRGARRAARRRRGRRGLRAARSDARTRRGRATASTRASRPSAGSPCASSAPAGPRSRRRRRPGRGALAGRGAAPARAGPHAARRAPGARRFPARRRPASLAPPPRPDEIAARGLLVAFRRALSRRERRRRSSSARPRSRSARGPSGSRRRPAATSRSERVRDARRDRVGADGRRDATSARVVAAAARPEELALARLAHHAVDRVLLPLKGRPLAAGRWDLLLDPLVAAAVVARLAPAFFGEDEDGFLAARTRDGRDALASPAVTLVDDAGAPGGAGPHDARRRRHAAAAYGRPRARPSRGPAHGCRGRRPPLEAAHAAMRSGGRSRSPRRSASRTSSSTRRPACRPSTCCAPSREASTPPCFSHARRSTSRRTASACTSAGYWVEKGRATDAVSETLLSGRLSELLRGIEAVGDDLKFIPAAGGGAGSPTLFVPNGRAERQPTPGPGSGRCGRRSRSARIGMPAGRGGFAARARRATSAGTTAGASSRPPDRARAPGALASGRRGRRRRPAGADGRNGRDDGPLPRAGTRRRTRVRRPVPARTSRTRESSATTGPGAPSTATRPVWNAGQDLGLRELLGGAGAPRARTGRRTSREGRAPSDATASRTGLRFTSKSDVSTRRECA